MEAAANRIAYLITPNGTILIEAATSVPQTLELTDGPNIVAWATKEWDLPVDEDGWEVCIDVDGDYPIRHQCDCLDVTAANEYYEGREDKCLGEYLSRRILSAEDLSDLAAALNLQCPAANSPSVQCSCGDLASVDSLPTFGGVEPDDTTYPIWSWDSEHYLLDGGGTDKGWHLALRSEIDALRSEDR